ncbi:MAG: hypothetical protein JNL58_10100 [Planctomyces sp.]|nr:hypothetical protein [Planctomyces sp.]
MAEKSDNSELDQQKREVLLDLTQFSLDLVGIFEPTPFADLTNAAISVGREDWLGAGLSVLSVLPYIGDLSKLGKLSRYEKAIHRAITLATQDAAFAGQVRPLLKRIKSLLDDVPAGQLPGGLDHIRDRLGRFLTDAPVAIGPVTKVFQKLPQSVRAGFLEAMKLPPQKNPRTLRKRPGPVSEDSLLEELQTKGFILVKKGEHSPVKMSPRGGAVEDSDIYMRRIVEGDKHYFEAIRIDRKFGGGTSRPFGTAQDGIAHSPRAAHGIKSPGDVQRADKPWRRDHNLLGSTSSRAGVAQGGGRELTTDGYRRLVNDLQSGSKKGEFSHWHHERIAAEPEILGKYLTGPVKGTQKFDNTGQLVRTW